MFGLLSSLESDESEKFGRVALRWISIRPLELLFGVNNLLLGFKICFERLSFPRHELTLTVPCRGG